MSIDPSDTAFDAMPQSLADGRSISTHLADVAEKAKDYARASRAENTRRAYDADWRQFTSWLRRQGFAQGLDCGPGQTEDGTGWIEIVPGATSGAANKESGVILFINGKTGWREVEISRGSRPETCPVTIVETWMRLGRIGHGPHFRRIAARNGGVGSERLNDKHVERLVKRTALACAATFRRANANGPSRVTVCVPASPAPLRWMKPMCRSISATPGSGSI